MENDEVEFKEREESVALHIPSRKVSFIDGKDRDKIVISMDAWSEINDQEFDRAVKKFKEEARNREEGEI